MNTHEKNFKVPHNKVEVLARIYFTVTGHSSVKWGKEKKCFLLPVQDMGVKTQNGSSYL
jgi:hypothetical protein